MKENNELLMHIYDNSDMGVKATKYLIKLLKDKDNKIKSLLETELHEYEEFLKESKNLLKKNKIKGKSKFLAATMANWAMSNEIDKDNSDSKIANLLTRGFVMGTVDLGKKIDDFKKETSKEIIKLAQKSMDFQNNQITRLKEYL